MSIFQFRWRKLVARECFRPSLWYSSNRQRECSMLTIGRILLDQMQPTAALCVAAVAAAVIEASENWG